MCARTNSTPKPNLSNASRYGPDARLTRQLPRRGCLWRITAEAQIFERVRALTDDQMAILISHRFSTVRMADEIAVLEAGRLVEQGTHGELMGVGGRYATLFELQAKGYR